MIGGTAFTANGATNFYSGYENGDSTGVTGLKGCYSAPPEGTIDLPGAIILPESGSAILNTQGLEDMVDEVRLLVLVANVTPEAEYPNLLPFRDNIPVQLRKFMTLNQTASVSSAFMNGYKAGTVTWAGDTFYGLDCKIRIQRYLTGVTYIP